MRGREIKVTCYLIEDEGTENEKVRPFNELTEDEVEDVKKVWSERLARSMAGFYNTHPIERERILKEY